MERDTAATIPEKGSTPGVDRLVTGDAHVMPPVRAAWSTTRTPMQSEWLPQVGRCAQRKGAVISACTIPGADGRAASLHQPS
ncbi:hypothetical protein GCM10023196_020350 [Actinoallomurus vinaceus]|uniref:Uncharacterized protein n=1 Tax=Actinoallomurus vinaceus TaxID=1080074 RepID=A0ABP8U4A0_9ACTN